MKKSDLLKFIELYNLSGTVERVKIDADGSSLKTVFITEDKTLYGNVSYTGLKLDKGTYGIHDTKQLIKMLGVLEEDINPEVVRLDDKRAVGISFSDENTESMVMLADLSVIPSAPSGVNPGKADLEVLLDEDFVERYIRAKNALAEVNNFTFLTNPKTSRVEMIIGHSSINSNRIRLELKTTPGLDTPAKMVSFNADYFKEALMKNRGMSGMTLKVNSAGLAHLAVKTAVYEANYYFLKITLP